MMEGYTRLSGLFLRCSYHVCVLGEGAEGKRFGRVGMVEGVVGKDGGVLGFGSYRLFLFAVNAWSEREKVVDS